MLVVHAARAQLMFMKHILSERLLDCLLCLKVSVVSMSASQPNYVRNSTVFISNCLYLLLSLSVIHQHADETDVIVGLYGCHVPAGLAPVHFPRLTSNVVSPAVEDLAVQSSM